MAHPTVSPAPSPPSPWNPRPEPGVPIAGEVILMSCETRRLGFRWGPGSAVSLGTIAPDARAASVVSMPDIAAKVVNPTSGTRRTWHLFLVAEMPDDDGNAILYPIFSYSRPPKGHPSEQPWDPHAWMRDAHEAQAIHHLPVPAVVNGIAWVPPPNPHRQAPVLSFGEWKNDVPAWLAASPVEIPFQQSPPPVWRRFQTGPVIVDSPEITALKLTSFSLRTIPSYLHSTGHSLHPRNSLGIRNVIIPSYDTVWSNIFSHDARWGDDVSEDGAGSEHTDNVSRITDPMWIWNLFPRHPGAPEWAIEDNAAGKLAELQEGNRKLVADWDDGGHNHTDPVLSHVQDQRYATEHFEGAELQEVELGQAAVP